VWNKINSLTYLSYKLNLTLKLSHYRKTNNVKFIYFNKLLLDEIILYLEIEEGLIIPGGCY
jgi:hypothetical protein